MSDTSVSPFSANDIASDTRKRLDPALLKLAGVLVVGLMAASLDTTMVNVAIDRLGRDLHSPISTVQWVTTGYLLSYAMVIPLLGWLTARIGTKNLWVASLALFFASSLLCGIAWNVSSLIIFRILQGAGGGMMLVQFQSILARAAGPNRLGRIMSIAAMPAMLAPILGPVIGGLIVTNLSWRWIFYVNVPTCAIGLVLARRALPAFERGPVPPLDRRGLLLLTPALAAVIYGLSKAGTTGEFFSASVLAPVLAGVVLLGLFTAHALTTEHAPIVDLRLMRVRSYSSALVVIFIMGFGIFATLLILPLYYQQARGLSALDAGLLMAPQGAGVIVGLLIVSRLTDRIAPRLLVLSGIVLTCAGSIAYTQVSHHPDALVLAGSLLVRGFGMSLATVPAVAALFYGLNRTSIPEAAVSQRIFQQVGASLGTAILAVILQRQSAAHIGRLLTAFDNTFWWTVVFSAIAVLPAWFLPGRVHSGVPAPNREVAAGADN